MPAIPWTPQPRSGPAVGIERPVALSMTPGAPTLREPGRRTFELSSDRWHRGLELITGPARSILLLPLSNAEEPPHGEGRTRVARSRAGSVHTPGDDLRARLLAVLQPPLELSLT